MRRKRTVAFLLVLCASFSLATTTFAHPGTGYLWSAPLGGRAPDARIYVTRGTVLVRGGYDAPSSAFPLDCGVHRSVCTTGWSSSRSVAEGLALHAGTLYVSEPHRLIAYPYPCGSSVRCRPKWIDSVGPLRAHVWRRKAWLAAPDQLGTPVVSGGVVYVGAQTVTTSHPAENLGRLYAYPSRCPDRGGCALLWTSRILHGAGTPVVRDGVVYEPSSSGLFAFPVGCRADGGICRELWWAHANMDLESMLMSPPVFSGTEVFVTSTHDAGGGEGKMAAVFAYPAMCRRDGGRCRPLWSDRLGRDSFSTDPLVVHHRVYAASLRGPGLAYRATCGSEDAHCTPARTYVAPRNSFGPIAIARNELIAVSAQHTLLAFPLRCDERNRCLPRWSWRAPGAMRGPIVGRGLIYVSTRDTLYALRASGPGGAPRWHPFWSWRSPRRLGRGIVVHRGIILVTSGETLFALRAPAFPRPSS